MTDKEIDYNLLEVEKGNKRYGIYLKNHIEDLAKERNKLNNNVENLEWVTPKENTNRAWQKGLAHNTKYQREVARKTMLDRWENNNHRLWRGTKTKQFSQMEYRIGE